MPGQPERLSPSAAPASVVGPAGTVDAGGKDRRAARRRLVVVGSGIAGLYAALLAAGQGADVVLLSKGRLSDSNTWYAQGGISAVLAASAAGDTVAAHVQDTLRAGAGHCEKTAVELMCTEADRDIAALQLFGVHFDIDDGGAPALGLEAAHSAPRILHAGGDATGAKIAAALIDSVLALADADGLTVLSEAHATVLLQRKGRVTGVEFLHKGQRNVLHADAVLLATGGAGQLFARTTNPAGATADGLALAVRAGAAVADLEFLQFHPTCLVGGAGIERSGTSGRLAGPAPYEGPLLISEAVRGEGAFLVDGNGRRFLQAYHPDAELAPRDVVSRSIALHLAKLGDPCGRVFLDARAVERAKGSGFLAKRFPTLTRKTRDAGFDWTRDLVPVAPAAHYWMGGIATDLQGRTTVPGLLAAGEAACTGVQGANRLASNSLLEALVFSRRAVEAFLADDPDWLGPGFEPGSGRLAAVRGGGARAARADAGRPLETVERGACTVPFSRDALRKLMTAKAGVLRDGALLAEAAATLAGWAAVVRPEAVDAQGGQREHEDRNLLLAAQLLVDAARSRPRSLGAHYRNDYPAPTAGTAGDLHATPPIRPKASLLHD